MQSQISNAVLEFVSVKASQTSQVNTALLIRHLSVLSTLILKHGFHQSSSKQDFTALEHKTNLYLDVSISARRSSSQYS